MKKSLYIAIGIQVAIMLSVLVPPLFTIQTGDTVYLETRRVDPRALFRGDYVTLDYEVGLQVDLETATQAYETGKPIYITVTTDRPAQFVGTSFTKPKLQSGQACVVARAMENVQWQQPELDPRFEGGEQIEVRQSYVRFPQIAQYFVPEGTGRDLEQDLNTMVAEIAVTKSCNAVVRSLELL